METKVQEDMHSALTKSEMLCGTSDASMWSEVRVECACGVLSQQVGRDGEERWRRGLMSGKGRNEHAF